MSWTESLLKGGQYKLTVTVELNGVDALPVYTGTPSGDPATRITRSGTHTVAGPTTDLGAPSMGDYFVAAIPTEYGPRIVSSHMVGSQVRKTVPIALHGLHGGHFPRAPDSGAHARTYDQTVGGLQTTLSIKIPKALYRYYTSRHRIRNFGSYVSAGYDDPYIEQVAGHFEAFGDRNSLSPSMVANHAIAFVQDLKYTPDDVATGYNEYPKYPVETLVDRGGDCEDTVILLAALLEQLGFSVKLILMPDANHMALGLHGADDLEGAYYEADGKRYYFVETTGSGFRVGDLPSKIKHTNAKLVDIDSAPVLVHKWVVTVSGYGATIQTSLRNMGKAPARDAQLKFAFETKDGTTPESTATTPVDIPPESTHSETLSVMPPDDIALRVAATVVVDGSTHDRSQSEFQAPVK